VSPFDLDGLNRELSGLKEMQNDTQFYNDLEKSKIVNKRVSVIEKNLEEYYELDKFAKDIEAMIDLSDELNDDSMEEEIVTSLK